MRPGIDAGWLAALEAQGIRTAILARLDFESETVFCWTGHHPLQVQASGDPMLDGNTFEPIANGTVIDIGDNQFSYSGSEALTITLGIPATPTSVMLNAAISSSEYQSRNATLWRAMIVGAPTSSSAAVWSFRPVRSGAMDELSISHSGDSHTFRLTIEGHASMSTKATGSTYLDQRRFDPTDTSNDFAVSIANNRNAPSMGVSGSSSAASGGGRGGGEPFNPNVNWQ